MAVGSFLVESQIGKGSFATVYAGRHKVSPFRLYYHWWH